jgi:hypothetical protein
VTELAVVTEFAEDAERAGVVLFGERVECGERSPVESGSDRDRLQLTAGDREVHGPEQGLQIGTSRCFRRLHRVGVRSGIHVHIVGIDPRKGDSRTPFWRKRALA